MQIMFRKFLIILLPCIWVSCSSNNAPDQVTSSDTQTILGVDVGTIIDVVPVEIKGEGSIIGATAGGMIGGLVGAVIGDGSPFEGDGRTVSTVYGAAAGAALGYFIESKLGDNNGFQIIIQLDDQDEPIAIIQGQELIEENNIDLSVGTKVSVVYGKNVRILPFQQN